MVINGNVAYHSLLIINLYLDTYMYLYVEWRRQEGEKHIIKGDFHQSHPICVVYMEVIHDSPFLKNDWGKHGRTIHCC